MRTRTHFEEISDDLFISILEFQSVRDFAVTTSISKKLLRKNTNAQTRIWLGHLCKRWNVYLGPFNYMTTLFQYNFKRFFPYCSPMSDGLVGNKEIVVNCLRKQVIFYGAVGESNRSVQSNFSFPSLKFDKGVDLCNMITDVIRSTRNESTKHLKFFSVPFAIEMPEGSVQYCTTPRSVLYYEVMIEKITPHPQTNRTHEEIDGAAAGENETDNSGALMQMEDIFEEFECVAVGLGTKHFPIEKRLPGWDNESYGYHGDDGAIFHGRGHHLGHYGPKFGYGDVVGCGVNYDNQSVFFTLNGTFLGTAFHQVPLHQEWYPTVGIDAHCSVTFNFGAQPFRFNLLRFIHEAELFCM